MEKDVTVVAVDLAKDMFQIAGGDGCRSCLAPPARWGSGAMS